MCNTKRSHRSFFSDRNSRVSFAAVQFSSRTVNYKTLLSWTSNLPAPVYGRLRKKGFERIVNSFAVFHPWTAFVWGQHVWRNDGPFYSTISLNQSIFVLIFTMPNFDKCTILRRPTKPPWCFFPFNTTVRRLGDRKGCNNIEKEDSIS